MTLLYVVLLVLAVVFFAARGFNLVSSKFDLVALGLFCWALVVLIQTARTL